LSTCDTHDERDVWNIIKVGKTTTSWRKREAKQARLSLIEIHDALIGARAISFLAKLAIGQFVISKISFRLAQLRHQAKRSN
jgi:hypothetical protein